MTEISALTKIIIAAIIFIMWLTCAYLGWRVHRLNKRVELLQLDRNKLLEDSSKEIFGLSELERKMLLNALLMTQYKEAMEDPSTKHHVRKAYKELKEKVKGSLEK
ncbi:MAG: hypothetical protein V3V81_07930 [Candidatus Bathyarchaeia archaeon]